MIAKFSVFLIIIFLIGHSVSGQNLDLKKIPKPEYITGAKEIAKVIFENLKNKKYKEIADYVVGTLGYNWDETKKISTRNDYLSKLEIIGLKPPKGVFGDLNGYDLIEEGFIKGSDRYFRHCYMTYHEGSILIWEFRFYVDKGGKVTLHYLGWSDKNPFEYMSTSDILLPKYDK